MNEKLFNISSGPHVRSPLTTGSVMFNVIISLIPATMFGVWHFGWYAAAIIFCAVASCVISEYWFDVIAKKKNTIKDGSAVVTGLLLALSLSPTVPLYIPIIGGIFAILVVKCFFGGLGKNFMNPALTARCFLLISFGTQMTKFTADTVSGATPLAMAKSGEILHNSSIFFGYSYSVIGGSALALIIGGVYLLITGGITLEIPAACIVSFTAFLALFGGHGLDISYLALNIFAGGILMGAFFMATDPVTSPVTSRSQIAYGVIVGVLAGLFRVKGSSADSVSYAIIISNMLVPFLDKIPIHKPLGYAQGENEKKEFPKSAVNLCIITLIAGLALSSVFAITKGKIEEQEMAAKVASYKAVLPIADTCVADESLTAMVEELSGSAYDSASFGNTRVNEAVIGQDASGNTVGYVFSVSSNDGYDGEVTLSVGVTNDGMVTGIAFTTLHETAGMGMRVDEDVFKDQFKDVTTDAFVLNKSGNSTADNEIDTVSGASTTSGAVVNAVNTALAFYRDHVMEGGAE